MKKIVQIHVIFNVFLWQNFATCDKYNCCLKVFLHSFQSSNLKQLPIFDGPHPLEPSKRCFAFVTISNNSTPFLVPHAPLPHPSLSFTPPLL